MPFWRSFRAEIALEDMGVLRETSERVRLGSSAKEVIKPRLDNSYIFVLETAYHL